MSRSRKKLEDLKLTEGGRARMPLSLTTDDLVRIDLIAKRLDLARATVARLLILRAIDARLL